MTEEKTKTLEREYVIPLRKEWLKVPEYRRAGKAAKAIKIFIAKHMKVPERDIDKVKIDSYLNNEIWFRGKSHPPSKIKVKATKEGEIVRVEFVETPEHIKFLKAKHERFHREAKKEEKKEESKGKVTSQETAGVIDKEEKKEEKKVEVEKEKSVEKEQIKEARTKEREKKHVTKVKEAEIKRTSMNRH